MPVMRYREALNQALREEMEADENGEGEVSGDEPEAEGSAD